MRRLPWLIVLVLLTQACGIRGPLYIETPEQKRKAEERRERREAAARRGTQRDPAQREASPSPQPAAAARAEDRDAATTPSRDLTDEPFGLSVPPQ